jgi:hypothetical protein
MIGRALYAVSALRQTARAARYQVDGTGRASLSGFAALCFGLAVATACVAQEVSDPAGSVALPSNRVVGERFVIETTTTTQRISGSSVTQAWRHETVAVATAEEVTPAGYILDLNTRQYEIAGDHRLPTGLPGRLADMQKKMPVKLSMTAAGAVDGIANLPEVLSESHRAKLETAEFFDSLNMPAAASKAVDQILSELTDPDFVVQSILEAPRLYFSMAGTELEHGATYYIEDTIVFPLLVEPLPSRIYFGVREIDPEARTVTYDWWQEPDQAVFREQLGTFIRQFAEDAGTGIDDLADLDLSGFRYHAEATLVYGMDSGLPLSMDYVKEISVPERRTVETVQARTSIE